MFRFLEVFGCRYEIRSWSRRGPVFSVVAGGFGCSGVDDGLRWLDLCVVYTMEVFELER